MTHPSPELQDFGRAMARAQDETLAELELQTKERLLASTPPTRRRLPRARALGVVLAAAALLCGLWWLVLRPRPLSFTIGDPPEPGRLEEWIAAPPNGSLGVRFSDGTALELGPRSRLRVVETSGDGAVVVVERGRIYADVAHRNPPSSAVRWRLHVGPYELRVRGTRFSASWDPEQEQLGVELEEGALVVAGPGLEDERAIGAGTRLEAHAPDRRSVVSKLQPSATSQAAWAGSGTSQADADGEPVSLPAEPGDAGLGGTLAADAAVSASDAVAGSGEPDGGGPEPSWRQLFRARNYAAALRRAKADDFGSLCQRSDPNDLMALFEVARKGGAPELAELALLQLRARFPGDGGAPVAAYELGAIAFDYHGDYRTAVRWFSSYLGEQPGGTMAREATGRLMEAMNRSGDHEGARRVAQRYLAAYPTGPHAEQAKRLLGAAP